MGIIVEIILIIVTLYWLFWAFVALAAIISATWKIILSILLVIGGIAAIYLAVANRKNNKKFIILGIALMVCCTVGIIALNKKTDEPCYPSSLRNEESSKEDNHSKYKVDEGRDSIVSLNFLTYYLSGNVTDAIRKDRNAVLKQTEGFQELRIHKIESLFKFNNQSYPIKLEITSISDSIGKVKIIIDQDIYDDLLSLYKAKYGESIYHSWSFSNQSVNLFKNHRAEFFYHSKIENRDIYNYIFEDIQITYIDYELNDKIEYTDKLWREHKHKEWQYRDSLLNLQKLKEQREKDSLEFAKQSAHFSSI